MKILPFDEDFKLHLIGKWESMSPDERYRTERVLWDLYDAIYTMLLDEKIALTMQDKNSTVPLDADFYKKVRQEVEEEMSQTHSTTVSQVDLSAARKELEDITKNSN